MGIGHAQWNTDQKPESRGYMPLIQKEEKSSVKQPDYAAAAAALKTFSENVQALAGSNALHAKQAEVETLRIQKRNADGKFNEVLAQDTAPGFMNFSNEKSWMYSAKNQADISWRGLEQKAGKYIAAHRGLEKHRGSAVAAVVKHASEIQQNKESAQKGDVGAQAKQKAANAQAKEAVKSDKYSEHLESGSKLVGFVNNMLSLISDGADAIESLKGNAEGIRKKLTGGRDYIQKVKKTGKMDWASALCGFLNTVLAGIELIKDGASAQRIKASDRQEEELRSRERNRKLADLFSGAMGLLAPLVSPIPIVGPILGIVESGWQVTLHALEMKSNNSHAGMMDADKKALWQKIESKRKENKGTEYEQYYDIGKSFWGKENEREQNDSDIEAKRQKLMDAASETGVLSGAADASQGLSQRMSAMRDELNRGKNIPGAQERAYKKKVHIMEALDLMNQYHTLEKAKERMKTAAGDNLEGLITNCVRILANGCELVGQLTAASGVGLFAYAGGKVLNTGVDVYEAGKQAWEWCVDWFGYGAEAEAKESQERKNMAEMLYDKMLTIGPHRVPWDGDYLSLAPSVPDYKVEEEHDIMSHLNSVLRRGLDARVSILLTAPSPKAMKQSLASSFSQEGTTAAAD